MWVAMLAAAACGGSGDGARDLGIFPLWVATDVAIADIDGDGRPDVLTTAGLWLSENQREGRLNVYRQTSPGTFAAPETYVVGTYLWRIVVADLDGDGAPDLLLTDAGDTRVDAPQPRTAAWVVLQDRSQRGRFLAPTKIAAGQSIADATAADVNSDGAPDIVLGDSLGLGVGAAVLLQDPTRRGTFLPPRLLPLPGTPRGIADGDFDDDGRTDLAFWVTTSTSGYTPTGSLAVAYQRLDGIAAGAVVAHPITGVNAQRIVAVDANGDGMRDIVVYLKATSTDYKARLMTAIQQPRGIFAGVETSVGGLSGLDAAAIADLDGDTLPDASVAGWWFHQGNAIQPRWRANVFAQSGGGAFTLRAEYDTTLTVGAIAAGDLDGDGRDDLVLYGGQNDCRVMYQSRTVAGAFEAARPLR
jgi:hypothetical protein